jgi:pilus assembly protein Flp/PilA
MMETLRKLWSDDEGQDLVEYALLVALVSIAAITILGTLGTKVSTAFSEAVSGLTPA